MPQAETRNNGSNGSSNHGSSAAAPASDAAAEAAVLSAILLKPTVLDEVRDLIEPFDFWQGSHRALYEALLALDDSSVRIDTVTVRSQLEAAGAWQRVGGAKFLAEICDATPSVANVEAHARLVRDLGLLRRTAATLKDLAATAQRPETRGNVKGFLEQCESEVFSANRTSTDRDTGSGLREMMAAAATDFDVSKPHVPRGKTTGIRELDDLTLGLQPGELWYVAARPGRGKTALALGMAEAIARTGGDAAVFFSMEMTRPELAERLISMMSAVHFTRLQKRQLTADDMAHVMSAIGDLGRYPIRFDDSTVLTPSRLRSRLRRHEAMLRAEHPLARLRLVVVDYVQLMAWEKSTGNRNDELERISRALKILAGEFNCAVVALSQLNRPKPGMGHIPPSLTELRGSGALEQDANKVLFIHRADDDTEGGGDGDADLILAKGRNAGTGRVRATWQPWCVRFTERAQERFAWAGPGYDGPESGERS
jgi:replicative DNA helicase